MAIEVDIYEKIRYYHEQEGKSQRAIAKILGISRNTVKKYYDGSHVPWERQGISGRWPYIIKLKYFLGESFAATLGYRLNTSTVQGEDLSLTGLTLGINVYF